LPFSLVSIVFAIIETTVHRREALLDVEIHLMAQLDKHAAQIDGEFFAATQIPKTLSAMLSVDQTQNEEEFDAMIRGILKASPSLIGSCIAFEPSGFREGVERFAPYVYRRFSGSGELFSADLAKTYTKDYKQWDWYRIPKETGQASWSEPYFDEGGGNVLMCTYSAPLFRNDRFIGVVTVDVSLDEIRKAMSQISPDGTMYRLLSTVGTFIAAPEPELVMSETIFSLAEKRHDDDLATIGHDMLRGKSGMLTHTGIHRHQRIRLAYTPLPITGWSLMATLPESRILAPVYERLYRSVFRFIVELAVISALIIVVSWRLATPIKRLAQFAKTLAAGDLHARIGNVRLASEIDQLALAFDKMVVDLKSNIEHRLKGEADRKILEGELKAARKIQASLLPRIFPPFPHRNEFALHATNEPATFIAGDFFDFFFIEPDKLAFVIADVSGHGIPAALFMAVSRTAIRTFAVSGQSPREIIDRVNRVLCADNDDMMFVTLFYGHYDIPTGDLTYVNAGHNPPYVVRKDGHLEKLSATGPLVATMEDVSYEEQMIHMNAGDLLVTFTDGVTEAHSNRDNILYGEERLEQLLQKMSDRSVKEICDIIRHDADHFANHERQDDTTLLVLRRNETSSD
jgi:sigma-B regulation protein RsbU (phosphoserine phosphatase)